ncbi:MAG: hypothetical protein D3913_05675, partial [Candidatus Electrothrix sp. LOE1_4_5]|nr:hypothetical protein [Candidatus Electrothrix gigas]
MPSFYRCENEFGDPCTFALENRKIPAEEALPNMDGGQPKCPGKTQSGKDCGRELIPIEEKTFPTGPLLIAGGILGSIVLIWFVVLPMLQEKPDPSLPPVVVSDTTKGGDKGSTSNPIPQPDPPIVRQPEPETSEYVDPWWVYQQLETTS